MTRKILPILIAITFLAACSTGAPEPVPTEALAENTQAAATATAVPEPTAAATEGSPVEDTGPADDESYPPPAAGLPDYPVPEAGLASYPYPEPGASNGDCTPLSPTPQTLQFLTDDGLTLTGTFYPPAGCAAPVVLLMHQFGSSKESWTDLAAWMQNRGSGPGALNWLPPMPADRSFAVFAFDFRGHGESEQGNEDGIDAEGFLKDAQAALAFVKTLPNVQPDRIISMGASIGADASLDTCLLLEGDDVADFQEDRGCIGAFAFSPGSFLDVPYVAVATRLSQPPFDLQIGCAASEQDGNTADLCGANIPGRYSSTIYPGQSDHGIALLKPGLDPDIGQIVLNFLLQAVSTP